MPTKIRVAFIALHFAEYSAKLAAALASKAEVLLVLYRNNADDELGLGWHKWLANENLKVIVLERPRSALAIIKNTFELISAIKAFAPSVMHYQEVHRDEVIFSAPSFRSIPKVITVHDPAPHSGMDSKRFQFSRLRIYRYLMRHSADAAITHGQLLASALEAVCPKLTGKVIAIAHGPLGSSHALTPSLHPNTQRLLFFGRIHKYKGLNQFVKAVLALRREGHAVTGVVAGKGSDLDEHRSAMDEAGCFEVIDQFIPSEDVPRLFLESRAVVLPYTDGTQSGVAALALGYGRPVVATAVGSIPELVRHEQNGLLVAPGDIAALIDSLRRILLDDELWERLAAGAISLRDGELSWDSISNQTLKVYSSVVYR